MAISCELVYFPKFPIPSLNSCGVRTHECTGEDLGGIALSERDISELECVRQNIEWILARSSLFV